MRTLWLNTVTMEHTFSAHATVPGPNSTTIPICPNNCLSAGFDSTYTWVGSVNGVAGEIVYALPAPVSDDEPQPLRMALRNDGYGTSEKHPRMHDSVGAASSNPDNSSRVFGGGESSYR